MFNSTHAFARNSLRDAFLANDCATPAASPARLTTPDLSLELIVDRLSFDALEADWNGLFDRAGCSTNMFQSFNWNWHWAEIYLATSPNVELAVVTARRGGKLVAVWPLVVERTATIRVLAWMGAPVSQYGDVLAERGPGLLTVLRECWTFAIAATRADAARFVKTRADATVAPLLDELGLPITQHQEAPFLDLASAPSWEAYAERYIGKGRWKNRRRQQRRLEQLGQVCVSTWSEGPGAVEAAARAVATKRAWLKDRGLVSPAVLDDRFHLFFAAVAESNGRPTGIQISELTCGGAPAAIEITIRCRDRMGVHVLAYGQTFEKCGPGNQLMENQLACAHADGVAVYDLLAPGSGYKTEWADGSVAVYDHAAGFTLAGVAYACGWLRLLRPALKRIVDGLPVNWRSRISLMFERQAAG